MELTAKKESIKIWISKYKYLFLILFIGLILMILPVNTQKKTEPTASKTEQIDDSVKLQSILERISGAGRVEVLLTVSVEQENIYQIDEERDSRDSGDNTHKTTVVVADSSRNESGLIQKINAPIYRGALIVCDGADNPEVRLAIFDAVSKVTGLSTNHIAVIRME